MQNADAEFTVLINPWIYDFSAYDLWLRPLGLLHVAAHLRQQGSKITFFDCLDYRNRNQYGCGKFSKIEVSPPKSISQIRRPYYRYGIAQEQFVQYLKTHSRPEAVFIGSGMTYWYPGVQETIKIVRTIWSAVPITLGGIYAALCSDHARNTSGADCVEPDLCHCQELSNNLSLRGVSNASDEAISSRSKGLLRSLRSLAMTRETRNLTYPAWDLSETNGVIVMRTSFGCPFNCSYCGAQQLQKEFWQRDPADVVTEIKHFAPRDVAFYDDALLVNADTHIKLILAEILRQKIKCRFHTPNAIHARFLDLETAQLMKKAGFETIRLGLETSATARNDNKVTNEELLHAVALLKKAGFSTRQIGVYTMFGSLDDNPQNVVADINFVTEQVKVPIKLSAYALVPGSPDYLRWTGEGRLPEDLDPLWHNKTIFPLLSGQYTLDIIRKLRRLASVKNKELI